MKTNNQFKFIKTKLPGVFLIKKFKFIDSRGSFIKTFSSNNFKDKNINSNFKESYYSYSYKNVIRGMHYSKYPASQSKLVTVVYGKILDVCLNLKQKNDEYGKFFKTILSSDNKTSIYIPDGYAHGFLVLSELAIVLSYMTSSYNSKYEDGILYNSFGYKWPITKPILSEKDNNLKKF